MRPLTFLVPAVLLLLPLTAGDLRPATPAPPAKSAGAKAQDVPQSGSCLADFDRMVQSVTTTYAGYEEKVTDATRGDFEALTRRLRQKAAGAGAADCEAILQEWLDFFGDGHLRVRTVEFFEAFARDFRENPRHPSFEVIDERFAVLRLPSFHETRPQIDRILKENEAALARIPTLIIDLRGNDGGSDWSYEGLLPLLYTDPIKTEAGAIRSSPASIAYFQRFLDQPGEAPAWVGELLERLRASPGEMVNVEPPPAIVLRQRAFPKEVAILIDGTNMSSAETFLLKARQSDKVKLFGSNTKGVVDYLNPVFETLPSGKLVLAIPITKRTTEPGGGGIDNVGIAPDVPIEAAGDKVRAIIEHYREAGGGG